MLNAPASTSPQSLSSVAIMTGWMAVAINAVPAGAPKSILDAVVNIDGVPVLNLSTSPSAPSPTVTVQVELPTKPVTFVSQQRSTKKPTGRVNPHVYVPVASVASVKSEYRIPVSS